MADIERPGRWIWEPGSRQRNYAEKFVQDLRDACKNEDDYFAFYQDLLNSQPDETETRTMLVRLVRAFYVRSEILDEAREEATDFRARVRQAELEREESTAFKARVRQAELESKQQKSTAGVKSGKSRSKKAKSRHAEWEKAAQDWLQEHKNPRGVAAAMAIKFSMSDDQMRKVLRKRGVIKKTD